MADPVLDRLRAERPVPAPAPLDVDALWQAGRRRHRRSVAAVAGATLTGLALTALVLPGLVDLGRPGGPPAILDQPEGGPVEGFQSDRAIWGAPAGNDADNAAALFIDAMEADWLGYTSVGVDVPEGGTETVVVSGEDGGTDIRMHLFREAAAPDRWYVVAVDSENAALSHEDGRAVIPLEPVPAGAVEVTVDRRTADGTDTVTVPVADLREEVGEDPAGAGVNWMLLRFRDAAGRLLAARGATWAGPWADVIEADTSSGSGAVPEGAVGDPELRFELDAVWTSPSVPDLASAARTFGLHAFGWHDVDVAELDASDDGPRWVRIDDASDQDAAVDVLLSPDPAHDDAWHVLQVGDDDLDLVPAERLELGSIPADAVTAVVEYGSDRAHSEQEVDPDELATGAVPVTDDPGFGEVTAAMVRFLDADGRLVEARGATFADEPGAGSGVPASGPPDR